MDVKDLKDFIDDQFKAINKNINEFKEYTASQLNEIKGNLVSLRTDVDANKHSVMEIKTSLNFCEQEYTSQKEKNNQSYQKSRDGRE